MERGCVVATRNHRLAAIHSLAHFIGLHSPEHIQWTGEIRAIPFKKTVRPLVTYLEKEEMDALFVLADKQLARWKQHMKTIARRMEQLRQRIEHGQLHGKATIGVRVGKVLNKYKVGKHFKLDIRDDAFSFEIDKKKVEAEAALDGIYVIRTSLSAQQMNTEDTVRSYKLLTQVERGVSFIQDHGPQGAAYSPPSRKPSPGTHLLVHARYRRGLRSLLETRCFMISIAPHISSFLQDYLPRQRGASEHTCDTYAYSFQLLFHFASDRLKVSPSELGLEQIDSQLVSSFLEHLENERGNTAGTRNVRLAAIKSFFRFLEYRLPAALEQLRRVLAIPFKKTDSKLAPIWMGMKC